MVAPTHRVPEAEAAARLPELLERAAAGEEVWIDRGSAAAVRFVAPAAEAPTKQSDDPSGLVAELKAFRQEHVKDPAGLTIEELIRWKHEGHDPSRGAPG